MVYNMLSWNIYHMKIYKLNISIPFDTVVGSQVHISIVYVPNWWPEGSVWSSVV
jgi:hypothetical protein